MSTCKIENMSFKDKIKTILDKDLHIERELEDLEFKKNFALAFEEMRWVVGEKSLEITTLGIDVKIITEEELFSDPYLSNICIPAEVKKAGLIIGRKNPIMPGILAQYNIPTINPDTLEIKREYYILKSSKKIIFMPSIAEEGAQVCWMSIVPLEINSFKKIIDSASGNVLLFGCGLIYAPYMIARKSKVSSVTVVDYSHEVISLCQEVIAPQFPNEIKSKMTFIASEAISFLKTCDLTSYDCVNVDVWYNTPDMIFTYLRCLEIELSNPNHKFSYWLEEKLMFEFQKLWMMALCEYPKHNYNMPVGRKLIKKIAEDLFKENDLEWTEDSFKQFINMDIKKFRELLLRWYTNNTVIFDKYYQEWESEEEQLKKEALERRDPPKRLERLKQLAAI